jgi:hypothetical protein
LIVGQFEERHDGLDARVFDDDVDRTELRPRRVDHPLDVFPPPDVARNAGAAAALPANRRHIVQAVAARQIVDGDVSAFSREHFGDAARRAVTSATLPLSLRTASSSSAARPARLLRAATDKVILTGHACAKWTTPANKAAVQMFLMQWFIAKPHRVSESQQMSKTG